MPRESRRLVSNNTKNLCAFRHGASGRAKRGEGKNEPTVFKFRVYFENITEEELNRLRGSLTFDDPDCDKK
jgi:hypothetical protein